MARAPRALHPCGGEPGRCRLDVHLFKIKALGEGDVFLVTRLDRLARSTRDLLNTLEAIGKAESLWLLWLTMFMRLASGSASGDWQLYSWHTMLSLVLPRADEGIGMSEIRQFARPYCSNSATGNFNQSKTPGLLSS